MRIATLTKPAPGSPADRVLAPVQVPARMASIALVTGLFLGLAGCQPGQGDAAAADGAGTSSEAANSRAAASGASAEVDANNDSGASNVSETEFATDEEKASYAMGFGVTGQVTSQFSDAIDHDAFLAGAKAQLEGRQSEIAPADAQRALSALSAAQQEKMALASSGNAKAGAEFLADNASKEGVVTTASGLQYLVLTEGSGAKPAATDTVKTHYEGKLINGEVFDSSVARGEPASFPLNRVIRGWTEALQLMNVGSKYRLFIPPELAYGNQPQGGIPAQSTLIFEVELLEILGGDTQ